MFSYYLVAECLSVFYNYGILIHLIYTDLRWKPVGNAGASLFFFVTSSFISTVNFLYNYVYSFPCCFEQYSTFSLKWLRIARVKSTVNQYAAVYRYLLTDKTEDKHQYPLLLVPCKYSSCKLQSTQTSSRLHRRKYMQHTHTYTHTLEILRTHTINS